MSGTVELWRVIHDGKEHVMIPDHHDTDHRVVFTGLPKAKASNMCHNMNVEQGRRSARNFFTGLIHMSAEAAGHCVKTVKDGYDKGRK